ncbi:IKI3 family-domain-containing protein [Polychytrium aggregatum]|uniref:IKI3 family-domain-containing protein n=1 Tax=Polychytrium aggregatum TaxID=110093 RepID=UPI0022FDB6EF|nr:IKI3 family-domain-containing protein [Polychytrium aggregatum]KAI9206900.1 IKI3 family-domain-containing protein [Polychytrium aggregatum]
MSICIGLRSGDILLLNLDGYTEGQEPEIVGTVDSGILSMEWSPDHEVVIVVTGGATVLEMTKDFDTITEVPIHTDEYGIAAPVSVGWGKKETQFHGSEGKAAAQRKAPSAVALSPDDTHAPRVAWRGDGQYFVCSSVDPSGDKRLLRVYDRECVLQSTSEAVNQLEHPLSWRPTGNLIASTQRLPHRHDVVFFERNGLRHGEFALREDSATRVVDVLWNADSTVLAVWLERCGPEGQVSQSAVQLWTMNNYYWYLKQEIPTSEAHDAFSGVQWDPEIGLRIHLTTHLGRYLRLDFSTASFVSTSLAKNNPASVVVIDGATVNVTPFKHRNVPPPMAAFKLTLPGPARHVAFGASNEGDDFAVLLSDGKVSFYSSNSIRMPIQAHTPVGTVDLHELREHHLGVHTYRQIAFLDPTTLIAIGYSEALHRDIVTGFTIGYGDVDDEDRSARIVDSVTIESVNGAMARRFLRLICAVDLGKVFVETVDGAIYEVEQNGGDWGFGFFARLPSPCPWIGAVSLGADDSKELAIVGLDRHNRLYLNDRLLASDSTSFFVHEEFLIFTTLSHTARFVELNTSVAGLVVPEATKPSAFDEDHRRVERGSQIVVATPASVNLVLQMPRGNLETMYPRALVLSQLRSFLDNLDYLNAFLLCRKHRIDMNILYDHRPEQFIENVEHFVRQINEQDYLNLFLSGLRNEDVTVTMYVNRALRNQPSTRAKAPQQERDVGKVNRICDTVRGALETIDAERYTQCILTTDVKKVPADLETAMGRIKSLRGTSYSVSLAEEALKYVIFLADADQLYDVALGMYDFSLVLMVAQHSQKDPREYLPFLSELSKLEMRYQHFKIDDHLKRYSRALKNLSLADEPGRFEECVEYIKHHKLFKDALEYFSADNQKYKAVMRLYAEHLDNNGDSAEAGLIHYLSGNKAAALASYKDALLWQEAFSVAAELGMSTQEVVQLGRELGDLLVEKRQYQSAAKVFLDYVGDPEEAVLVLLKGFQWIEAVRIAHKHGRADLVETHAKPALLDAFSHFVEDIKDTTQTSEKYLVRYRNVQQRKLEKELEGEGLPEDDALDHVDMLSDTTSMATTRITHSTARSSRMTSRTHQTAKTSRQKRRLEKKKLKGKEGGLFEEEYLLNEWRKMTVKVNDWQADLDSLARSLIRFGYEKQARELQQAYSVLVSTVKRALEEVFVRIVKVEETFEEFKLRVVDGKPLPPGHYSTAFNVPPEAGPKLNETGWGVSIFM